MNIPNVIIIFIINGRSKYVNGPRAHRFPDAKAQLISADTAHYGDAPTPLPYPQKAFLFYLFIILFVKLCQYNLDWIPVCLYDSHTCPYSFLWAPVFFFPFIYYYYLFSPLFLSEQSWIPPRYNPNLSVFKVNFSTFTLPNLVFYFPPRCNF